MEPPASFDEATRPLKPGKVSVMFVGTSSGVPTIEREGTQHQFVKKSLPFTVDMVLITHLHGDHCFGLPGFLAMRTMKKAENPIHIVGPVGIASLVQNALTLSQTFLPYGITFTELETGKSLDLGEREETITAAGRFLPETATSLGVPKTKMKDLIKDGKVTLEDGKVIHRHQCLAPPMPARKVVVLGDTSDASGIAQAATGCDLLVHEATFHSSLVDKAVLSGHSTGPMAAKFALGIGARRLALTHFSSRHTGEGITLGVKEIEQETKEVFGSNVIAACDFMEVTVETRTVP